MQSGKQKFGFANATFFSPYPLVNDDVTFQSAPLPFSSNSCFEMAYAMSESCFWRATALQIQPVLSLGTQTPAICGIAPNDARSLTEALSRPVVCTKQLS